MPVYKDNKTNKYYFSVRYKDTFGKNKRKVKRGFAKKKDAKLAESQFIQQAKDGYSDNKTFEEVFYDYLKNIDLRERTIRRKKYDYKNHIQQFFGDQAVGKITQSQCLEFRTYLVETCKSINTARTIWTTFKAVITYAMTYYKLASNPCLGVKAIPRVKTKVNFVTREEFHEKLEQIENPNYKDILTFMFYTGTRIGEAMGMLWTDIDLRKKEASVSKTWDITARKMADYPKTSSSVALLPMPNVLIELLERKYEESQTKIKGFNDEMFVFGGYRPPDYAHFSRIVKAVFPNITSHGLRHSYASFLADKGCDIYVLRDLLRHSSITETVDTYTHFYTSKKHDAMKFFND